MTKKEEIDRHNREVLKKMLSNDNKQITAVAKNISKETEVEKIGAKKIRQAYFKNWYESCKDIYNKERKKKRKEDKTTKGR